MNLIYNCYNYALLKDNHVSRGALLQLSYLGILIYNTMGILIYNTMGRLIPSPNYTARASYTNRKNPACLSPRNSFEGLSSSFLLACCVPNHNIGLLFNEHI